MLDLGHYLSGSLKLGLVCKQEVVWVATVELSQKQGLRRLKRAEDLFFFFVVTFSCNAESSMDRGFQSMVYMSCLFFMFLRQ